MEIGEQSAGGASSGAAGVPNGHSHVVPASGANAAHPRNIDFRRHEINRLQGWNRPATGMALVATIASIAWMYFWHLGRNPAGFFCDEAEIGIRTWQLLHGTLPSPSPRLPAFYAHIDYTIGAFSLYFGAPFVAAFGLDEAAVRASATVAMVIGLAALVLLTRRIGLRDGWIGVAVFGLSPITIHLARFNMGHPQGFMLTALGMLAYVIARARHSLAWSVIAGVLLGMSVYANASWYIAAPVTLACLALGELITNRIVLARWRTFGLATAGVLIAWIPLFHRMLTDEMFFRRFKEKQGPGADSLLSWGRWQSMADAYPKYFSFEYLFREGDTSGILRHSVRGAGLFPWLVLPLLVLGILAVIRERRGTGKVIGLMAVAMLVLYPAPDIPTTNPLMLPYSFSIFPMMIPVPILCAFGVEWVSTWVGGASPRSWRQAIVPIALTVAMLAGAWSFYRGPYAEYPKISAGYYGWQYGPGPAIEAFIADNNQHDHYYLDSDFNAAYVFPEFYLAENPEMAAKTSLGAPHEHQVTGDRMLYAVRPARWEQFVGPQSALRRYSRLVDVIAYPDGTPALLIISISFQNAPTPVDNW